MSDIFDKEKRSLIMSKVKNKNTKQELVIRKLLYSNGYRYRINYNKLPCRPDIVFPGKKKAIFINGCLWHGHHCKRGKLPESNHDKWVEKVRKNIERDKKNIDDLNRIGWNCIAIWQCEITKKNLPDLLKNIAAFLNRE